MASPQCENGYVRIANELYEAILRSKLHGQELKVMLAVIRLTYGFGKKEDAISHGQISKLTGIPRVKVIKIVQRLVLYRVLGSSPQGTRKPSIMRINKDFDSWVDSPPQGTIVPHRELEPSPLQGTLQRHIKDKRLSKPKKQVSMPDPRIKVFIDWWCQTYQKRYNGKKYAIPNGGKLGSQVRGLLRSGITWHQLQICACCFLDDEDTFIEGHDLGMLFSRIHKYDYTNKQTEARYLKVYTEEPRKDG